MRKRIVCSGEVHHLFQRTIEGRVIFYSLSDYLVFFTVYCTVADRLEIPVLALCPMPDHIHSVVEAPCGVALSRFVQQYTHLFAYEWNKTRERKGSLFRHQFGSATKKGNKKVRTTLAYNYNNAVERKLTTEAESYRWNFLPYARSGHPYSSGPASGRKSAALKSAMRQMRQTREQGTHVRYSQLDHWFRKLSKAEIQYLADSIISEWNVIDYGRAISYYGSLEAMIRAFHDNTGSEYDIPEDHDNYSDTVYQEFAEKLMDAGLVTRLRDIPALSPEEKERLLEYLRPLTSAPLRQIKKYLHL